MTAAEMVPVEQVTRGDTIRRPSGTTHVVAAVEHYEATFGKGECYVIVYVAYEPAPVPKCWKPLAPGEYAPIVRRAA